MRHQAVILFLLLAILPPLSASAMASAPEIIIFTKSGIGTIRADTVWEDVGNYRNLFHTAFQRAAALETAWCERPSAAASSRPT